MAFAGLFVLLSLPWNGLPWYWGVGGLVVGYLLQWAGHAVEGNDLGEWAGISRLLGLPYVAISPRYQPFPPCPTPAGRSDLMRRTHLGLSRRHFLGRAERIGVRPRARPTRRASALPRSRR
jgi:hypothetical protein